ncbi:hypothetical protein [Enterococcus nangangensis]|uniref:hypothetical protein n=1 Tax=Enterococcus nangangensis TaxID=2559926 RepID=UPI0010F60CC5|nr:hypothetical protein [Enterococcus nangangensis]
MKKKTRLLWSSVIIFILVSVLQIFLALTGIVIPKIVSWFYNGTIVVFFIAVWRVLRQKSIKR